MLKISAAFPLHFGPIDRKQSVARRTVAESLPDYLPDPNDVRLPDDTVGSGWRGRGRRWSKLQDLYQEWNRQGLVCIVRVVRYAHAADQPGVRWREVEEFLVARFTRINTAIMFKMSLD